MQNRGALWVFTILLALACLWQLSFSFFTGRFEAKAGEEAAYQADSVAQASGRTNLDMESLKLVLTNKYLRDRADQKAFLGFTYAECKEKELNLGLDLKGGMAVTLEVSIPELVDNLSENNPDPTFRQALANARTAQRSDNRDFITLFSEEFRKLDPNAKLAAVFHSPDKAAMFPREASNEDIVLALRREAETAINSTEKILRTRIDKFGVAQPSIQKQALSGRIQVELPGVKDKDRVRKVLQSTANLEFWETFDNTEVFPKLADANTKLGALLHPELSDAAASGAGFDHTLTSGVSIKGASNGVERKLIDFIQAGGPVDKSTWFDFDRVTFASNSAAVDTVASADQLNNLVEVMKAYPGLRLKIGGYTDSTGNEAANQKLSQERAVAVVAEITRKGVTADRLTSEGYGSAHPVASNSTQEGRAKNRRMALRVTSLGAEVATDDAWTASATDDLVDADTTALDTAAERANYSKKNPLFFVLQPNVANNQMMRGDVVGYALPSDTAEVGRLLRLSPPLSPDASAGMRLLWSSKPIKLGPADAQKDFLTLHAIKVPRGGKPKLDGTSIVDARQDFSLQGEAEVASSRMRRERAEMRLSTGIDPVTGRPRGEPPPPEPPDLDEIFGADTEPADADEAKPDRPALPGTRAPRTQAPRPSRPRIASPSAGEDREPAPRPNSFRQPITGGVRGGGVAARPGFGARKPEAPLNAGRPIESLRDGTGMLPGPQSATVRGGLLPRPRPITPRPSRETYDPY